jgi:hypothetical protein
MSYTITNGLCALTDVKAALAITDTNDDDRISLAIDSASRLIEKECNRRFWMDPVSRTDSGCVVTLNSTTVLDASITATDAGRWVTDPDGYIPACAVVSYVVPGVSFQLYNFEGLALPATGSGTEALTLGLTPRRFVSNDPWLVEVDDIATPQGIIVESDYAGDGTFGTTWADNDYQTEPVNGIMEGQAGWPTTALRAIRSLYFPVWGGIAYPRPYTQALVQITARWGWAAVPSDINKAAIIQSIALFRADDVPFGATPFGEMGVLRMRQALHPTAAMLIDNYSEQEVLVA